MSFRETAPTAPVARAFKAISGTLKQKNVVSGLRSDLGTFSEPGVSLVDFPPSVLPFSENHIESKWARAIPVSTQRGFSTGGFGGYKRPEKGASTAVTFAGTSLIPRPHDPRRVRQRSIKGSCP
jgi:hypothetical protein